MKKKNRFSENYLRQRTLKYYQVTNVAELRKSCPEARDLNLNHPVSWAYLHDLIQRGQSDITPVKIVSKLSKKLKNIKINKYRDIIFKGRKIGKLRGSRCPKKYKYMKHPSDFKVILNSGQILDLSEFAYYTDAKEWVILNLEQKLDLSNSKDL